MAYVIRSAVLLALCASLLPVTAEIPSPQSLGTDVEVLTHNDLYGNKTHRTDAVLVLPTRMSQGDAQQKCKALAESLWIPDANHIKDNDDEFLKYLPYQNISGPFWIGGKQGSSCKTISANGVEASSACNSKLPALCSNSAPVSNVYHQDNSTKWHTEIKVGEQWVTGFRDHLSFRFQGLRYAAQPERWTYSTPYQGKGNTSATAFQSQCVQASNVGSEDCLFLNVWTPYLPASSNPPKSKLKPVMFWIHGGAFTGGTGSDPTFDGGSIVSRGDVVLVTINYRLTTLGFLALDDGKTNGNYGIADQITALDWVRENIRAFGGNPDQITIFGQSAGAASVRALLASPEAAGKFQAAIPQSNLGGLNYGTTYSLFYNISEEVEQAANPILQATGCENATSQVDCLRKIDAHTLANLQTVARFLVVDGIYLTSDQLEVAGKGHVNKVPVLMGIMRDDGAAFIGYPTADQTVSEFASSQGFNVSSQVLQQDFPAPSGTNKTLDVYNATALLSTDGELRCIDLATAYSAVKHATLDDVYFYTFNRSYQTPGYSPNFPVCQPPITPGFPLGNPNQEYFKCHSGELYYVFGNLAFNGLKPRDAHDVPFSQVMLDTWSSFARSFNPNPSEAFLDARGFTNTSSLLGQWGKWQPVRPSTQGQTQRILAWPSYQGPFFEFGSEQQCSAIGLPLNYYENHS